MSISIEDKTISSTKEDWSWLVKYKPIKAVVYDMMLANPIISWREVSEKTGLSYRRATNVMSELRLSHPELQVKRKSKFEVIKEMVLNGCDDVEILKATGVSFGYLRRVLRELRYQGVDTSKAEAGVKGADRFTVKKKVLEELKANPTISRAELAKKYNRSYDTIRHYVFEARRLGEI